jgi:hypothetical protein
VNLYLRLWLTCHLLSAICYCRLYLLQISGMSFTLTYPVYLKFSWTHTPFVFSSIHPYQPFAIAVLFLELAWGGAPPPLSGVACHTLVAFGSFPLSKHTGEGSATPAFSRRLVYLQFHEGVPLFHSLELRVPYPLCYMSFFFQLFVYYSACFFLFFPWVGVSLSRGLC